MKVNRQLLWPVLICLGQHLLFAWDASAEEFYADARVVRVEPLTKLTNVRKIKEACKGTKPADAGIIELLHWDLGTGPCAEFSQEVSISGYRVFYEWNERTYTQTMDQSPGSYIRVLVSIEQNR